MNSRARIETGSSHAACEHFSIHLEVLEVIGLQKLLSDGSREAYGWLWGKTSLQHCRGIKVLLPP